MDITYDEWAIQIDEKLFYQDLRATLDGVEAGEIKKSLVTQLCKRHGYTFNWKNYSLKLNKKLEARKCNTKCSTSHASLSVGDNAGSL